MVSRPDEKHSCNNNINSYNDLSIETLVADTKPPESARSMCISKEFLEIIKLSFEAKDLSENREPSEENNATMKRLWDRMNVLLHSISIRADTKFDDIVVLAAAYYNIGLVYVNSKESSKLFSALRCFKACLRLLRGLELNCKAILTSIGALNEMNSIFVKLEKENYVYSFLKSAMEQYLNYTKRNNYPDPIHIPNIIGIKEKESDPRIILEDLHFRTLRNIATKYLEQPEDKHDFIIYMYNLLKNQLSQMIFEGRQFREDCINWVLTLFDMSRYFLMHNRFVEARNHLATADYIIYRFSEDTLKMINRQNDVQRLRFIYLSDKYDYVCGVSARSWSTYGVSLLRFWMKKYLQSKDEKYEVDNSKLEIESMNLLIFPDIQENAECLSNQITHTQILNLTDAQFVFIKILKYIDEAKKYFTADADIETYAEIILQLSAAYKYLVGFEQDRDVQLKLHKRRVTYLEDVYKKFHTIINTDTELEIYKRIWYEMIISCSTVIDLILEEMYHNKSKKIPKDIDRFAKLILGNVSLYLHVV